MRSGVKSRYTGLPIVIEWRQEYCSKPGSCFPQVDEVDFEPVLNNNDRLLPFLMGILRSVVVEDDVALEVRLPNKVSRRLACAPPLQIGQ